MGLTLNRRRLDASDAPKRPRRRRPHLIGELLIVIILVKVYDYVRSFAADRTGPARRHGQTVLDIERSLHIDIEHSLNHWLAGIRWLTLATAYWYQFFHIAVTLVVLAWCYVSRPILYRAARNALIITNVVGLAVFVVLPVMPPRMLPDGFTDSVAAAGFGSPEGGPVQADQYAAMPSLHLAWATWTLMVAIALLRGRRWRWVCVAYPFGTAFVVMSTGNHYLLDVVAGVTVALVAAWTTGMRKAAAAIEIIPEHAGTGSGGRPNWYQTILRRIRRTTTSTPDPSVTNQYSSVRAGPTPATAGAAASGTAGLPNPPGEGSSTSDSLDTAR
jgi:PAP2 superfamily